MGGGRSSAAEDAHIQTKVVPIPSTVRNFTTLSYPISINQLDNKNILLEL